MILAEIAKWKETEIWSILSPILGVLGRCAGALPEATSRSPWDLCCVQHTSALVNARKRGRRAGRDPVLHSQLLSRFLLQR